MGGRRMSIDVESDFSPRKMRIAVTVLIGIAFGSTLLLVPALTLTLVPMTREFGWTPTQFVFSTSLLMWFGACSGPVLGWIVDRVGVRPMIICGTIAVGALMMSLSRVHSLGQFYATIAALGMLGSTAVGYSKVIGALFTQHRGKAMAILGLEGSVAGVLIPQLIQSLLDHNGWRGTYLWLGGIAIAVAPLLYFSLEEPGAPRRSPAAASATAPTPAGPQVLEGLTLGEVLRTRVFWLILASHVLGGLPLGVIGAFMVPILMAHGYTAGIAANFQSLVVVAGAVGSMLGGFLLDRTSTARIGMPFCLGSAAAVALLATTNASTGGLVLLWAIAALYGFATMGRVPMAGYFHTRFFGLRAYAVITAVQLAVMAVVFGFAPLVVGRSQEASGSYDPALLVLAAGSVVAGAIYLFLGPYRYAAHSVVATSRAPAPTAPQATAATAPRPIA